MSSVREYTYIFRFNDGDEIAFTTRLDAVSQLQLSCPATPPAWARLNNHRCPSCTLEERTARFCPAAAAIAQLIDAFTGLASHTSCDVSCLGPERTVHKNTSLQEGLASLLGLLMATSDCPMMERLRPLARFHLPFATVDETIFRISAICLLHRQVVLRSEDEHDQLLGVIKEYFAVVAEVNRHMLARIAPLATTDADKNAIVAMESISQLLAMEMDSNFGSLHYLFA